MIQLGQGNRKAGRWCDMSTFQAISLMIAFGMFTISLISLIVMLTKDNVKRKK
ncbi:putative holin-like toxin [Anaerosalibacter bizertensis]|uniref:Putative holin-like toxin n=1 Tax=Anaerosalibacter bizertensis TaxID=932217 RepID=A0A844FJA4_9FIRM|nr:putative holin-like toxin [Anaerosalibacter bizertensis]